MKMGEVGKGEKIELKVERVGGVTIDHATPSSRV
jgi:hypothetical protein